MLGLLEKINQTVTDVGLEVVGFATNTVAPAVQVTGHAVGTVACAAAEVATFGKIEGLALARDDQARRVEKKHEQLMSGVARLTNARMLYYNSLPEDLGPWMARLGDETRLLDLLLPGTHQSCSRHGGDIAQCQAWSLREQLASGIRCFDVRVRLLGDAMCVHHGIVYQRANLSSVLETLEDFLRERPSEVLLVNVSDAGCHHDGPRDFRQHVGAFLKSRPQWRGCDLASETLGDLRGRIVPFAGPFSCTVMDAHAQNEYGDADKKFQAVQAHALRPRRPGVLFQTQLNAVGVDGMTLATPSGMAALVNKRADQEVGTFLPGVYMMDYPGTGMVRRIIDRNF